MTNQVIKWNSEQSTFFVIGQNKVQRNGGRESVVKVFNVEGNCLKVFSFGSKIISDACWTRGQLLLSVDNELQRFVVSQPSLNKFGFLGEETILYFTNNGRNPNEQTFVFWDIKAKIELFVHVEKLVSMATHNSLCVIATHSTQGFLLSLYDKDSNLIGSKSIDKEPKLLCLTSDTVYCYTPEMLCSWTFASSDNNKEHFANFLEEEARPEETDPFASTHL